MTLSHPRYPWWGYVRKITERYPAMRAQLDELQKQSVVAAYGPQTGRSSLPGRSTESAALRQLSKPEQEELDAVEKAISVSTEETVELIRLVFWARSHTLNGAAMRLHLSYRSARRRQSDFLKRVAKYRGLL